MEKVLNVAHYIAVKYNEIAGEKIDEIKLQKLLYFSQRECLAIKNEPLFDGIFEGWRYGPVCREIHDAFNNYEGLLSLPTNPISEDVAYIVNNVIFEYGALASWKLSELSHKEISWINSRRGLSPDDNGNVKLKLEDIKKDARRVRPYDYVWDMYYDEFDDCETLQ